MEQNDYHFNNPNQKTPPPPEVPVNNLALTSMIVGIFSLLSFCFPPLQFIMGMIGILLVYFSKKGKPWSGFAIAGLVMSIIALIFSILMVLYFTLVFQMMKDPKFAPLFNDIYQMYQNTSVQ